MSKFKCLTCRSMVSDKYIHTRRTDPPHKQFIQLGSEEEMTPSQRWTNEILSDELAGQKKISIKIETHQAIQEISVQQSGPTYDDIILAALSSYKREKESNGNDPLEQIATTNDEAEE